MDFTLSDQQHQWREKFTAFAEDEVAPQAEATDKTGTLPPALLDKAAALGFLGATLPTAYGGAGFDYLTYTLLVDAVARYCVSTATCLGIHLMLAAMTILDAGTEEQKQKYLPRLAGGELGAFALTEPEAGSDPASLQMRATCEGDTVRLDGVKSWVTNGGPASLYVVFAATEPGARHRGLTAFIVDRAEAEVQGLKLGEREETMGMRGLDIRTVYFDGCCLPAANRLGPVNGAWPLVMRAFNRVRISLAAAGLGAAQAALNLGVRYAVERQQFGSSIGQKPAVYGYVADCAVEIEALHQLVRYTAWLADTGQAYGVQASMAKYMAARVAGETADKMLQVHGGYGVSEHYAMARIYRDVRALRLLGGTDEIQRYAVARGVFEEQGLKLQP